MDAQYRLTSLSAGLLVNDILSHDAGVGALSNDVFPVVSEPDAVLPYICYRQSALQNAAAKGSIGADAVTVEVLCYANTYAQTVAIAEAVRTALDNVQATYEDANGTLVARSIQLIDSEEGWSDDAYIKSLTFIIRI